MAPQIAIESFCHISERKGGATYYTISDCRPKASEVNGKTIKVELIYGKYIYSWVER